MIHEALTGSWQDKNMDGELLNRIHLTERPTREKAQVHLLQTAKLAT